MEKSKAIKVAMIVSSIAVIVLATVQLLGFWDNAIMVFEPLMGLNLLLQTVQYWNKSRKTAIFSLCAAIFIFIVAIYILFF